LRRVGRAIPIGVRVRVRVRVRDRVRVRVGNGREGMDEGYFVRIGEGHVGTHHE
jgi:hypothetical protein